jgi:predicted RNase H-like nuclease (RuvC/YqgF family)
VLLILSSIIFSQTDTSRICFSYSKAKSIALDLVKGDSAIAELKLANKMIWQLNEKGNAQDSLVTLYVAKEQNYIGQILNCDQIVTKQKIIITGLESDVEKLNRKNERLKKGLKWFGGGFVASILTIITLVAIK